jgi:hypothetical protein
MRVISRTAVDGFDAGGRMMDLVDKIASQNCLPNAALRHGLI